MTLPFALFTYLNLWFIMLFFVIAICTKTEAHPAQLDYIAAPKKPYWKKIFYINSLITLVVTLLIAFLINSGLIPLSGVIL